MAKAVIALGSNLDDPHHQLQEAGRFLSSLSESLPEKSAIYRSEPVGPSENDFLNAVAVIETELNPRDLLNQLREQEQIQGRPSRYPKWTSRTLDLDIIAYDDLVIESDNLIIPHKEYQGRLFVLLPLRDVLPEWEDPVSAQTLNEMIDQASDIRIHKTNLDW